jgi:ribosomal protein S18 acetylase RimI-like enzyme
MIPIHQITHPAEVETAKTLFREYAGTLDVDLGFQGFEDEIRQLPGEYAPPRGALLLAERDGVALGCVAVRPISAEIAEMKRLYVRTEARGLGLGRQLAAAAIGHARAAGYSAIRLDTLPTMTSARALYASLGFRPIAPYRHNPIDGTAYLELPLSG